MSLEEAASKMIYDVGPILAVAKASGHHVKFTLYFSDYTITKAFKSGAINRWKQNGFTRRSGAQVLEHGSLWSLVHKLVEDLGAEVCYTPFDDPTMCEYYGELKDEYKRIIKQLKKNLEGT